MTNDIGSSSPPSSFRYQAVYEKGKPVHSALDAFSIKHPPMALSKRAKIFSPFDALKGFSEAITCKEAESTAGFEARYTDHGIDEDEGFTDDII
ncbi:MAG: hypothetical protein J6Y89_05020 [Lachnospiraceae bacterium]|nr:hypothetical protein [Lachnospiraceae bacterium]